MNEYRDNQHTAPLTPAEKVLVTCLCLLATLVTVLFCASLS